MACQGDGLGDDHYLGQVISLEIAVEAEKKLFLGKGGLAKTSQTMKVFQISYVGDQ